MGDYMSSFPPDCPYEDAGIEFSDFSSTAYGDKDGFINKAMTEQVIEHNHHMWRKLVNQEYSDTHPYAVPPRAPGVVTCGEVRAVYKHNNCCGNPNNPIAEHVPDWMTSH